jgi:hypothetical protein
MSQFTTAEKPYKALSASDLCCMRLGQNGYEIFLHALTVIPVIKEDTYWTQYGMVSI